MKRPHVADTFHFYFRRIVYWPQHRQTCKMPILTQRVFSDTHDVRNSFKTPINLAVTQNLNRFETTRPSSGLHVWYNPAANAAQEILKGIRHPQHTSNVAVFFWFNSLQKAARWTKTLIYQMQRRVSITTVTNSYNFFSSCLKQGTSWALSSQQRRPLIEVVGRPFYFILTMHKKQRLCYTCFKRPTDVACKLLFQLE